MSRLMNLPVDGASLNLAGLIALVEAAGELSSQRKRSLVSAIRAIARALGQPLSVLPADPAKLGKKLHGVRGLRHKAEVSKDTWKVYLARYRNATRLFGLAELPARIREPRSPAWITLLSTLPQAYTKYLGRFAGVMTSRGTEPAAVRPDDFELYREYIAKAAVRTGAHAFRWFCYYWNKALCKVSEWPDIPAPAIPRRKLEWLSWSAFPPSLEADIDAYYAARVQRVEFDFDTLFDGAPEQRIKSSTAKNYKDYLQALATAAVGSGAAPKDLRSLDDLLNPAVLEPAITQLVKQRAHIVSVSRNDNAPGAAHPGRATYDLVYHVFHIMKNVGKPPAQLERVQMALKNLEPSDKGMSARTRARLDVLRQPNVFRALYTLPERIFTEMRKLDQPTAQDAWKCAAGLVLATTFDTAFRRSNVIKLRIGCHFGAIDPRTGRMPIVVPGGETKNGETYVSELRARTVRLLDEYLQKWRPLLDGTGSEYLFPLSGLDSANGERTALLRMAGRVNRMVSSRLDLDFNLHLLRSLLATLYAEANPEDIRTAQVKLGHKTDRSTKQFYIDVDQRKAHRRFDEIIDQLVEGAPARKKRKTRDV